MLARDIAREKPAGANIAGYSHRELDIRDARALEEAMARARADWIFNCAAFTNVDAAQTQRDDAFAVNATAVGAMAKLCAERGVRLLHFSTDYVFSGGISGFYSENDATGPVNVYGESKLAGELAVQRSGAAHLIVRPQWLFGVAGRSFVGLMCDRARARQRTRVVADQVGCCTYTVDLARAAWELIERAEGIVHVANRGKVSRFTLAARVFEHFGVAELVEPCTSEEFGFTTPRPDNSALSVCRAESLLGRTLPPWEDALRRFVVERQS